jgi:hypothetical protein
MYVIKLLLLLLPLSTLVSCNGQLDLTLQSHDTGAVSLQLESDIVVSTLLMHYFEDLDLLMDNTSTERELPSVFEESIAFMRPYASLASVQKLGTNQVGFSIHLEDLVRVSSQLQQGGFTLMSVRPHPGNKTVIRFAMGAAEQQILAATLPILPSLPSRWTPATRSEYISDLANILAHTRGDRLRLEQELSTASLAIGLDLSNFTSPIRISTQAGVIARSQEQPTVIALNVMDFLSGNAWLELEW